jgi:dTDP-glucose 4,6-dehydratase
MPNTLLVTGAAGFIGSHFCRYWKQKYSDDTVITFDKLTYAGVEASLDDVDCTFVQGDIGDTEFVLNLLNKYNVDIVVNFAAESHNSYATKNPGVFFQTNCVGTQGLCEAARQYGKLTRLHHISTCEVYGDIALDSDTLFHEQSPHRPNTPYNASKAAADHVIRCYNHTYGLPTSVTSCANNYGPYQFPEKLIPLFIAKALNDKPLTLYKSSDNRREWIHAIDHCRAIDDVIFKGKAGETYHVGTGVEKSVEEISDLILDTLGKPHSLKTYVPDRPGHDRRYALDFSKIQQELGWEPSISFEDGMAETIEWYKHNEAWWKPLIGRSPVDEGKDWK